MNRIRLIFFGLLLCGTAIFAEFNPPPGGDYLNQISSPYTLGMSGVSFFDYSPSSTLLQPASGAGVQRLTLDASYTNIFSQETSKLGHAIYLGTSIPTKMGVFTLDGLGLTADMQGFRTGSFARLHGAFSKDIYEDFFIGAGINGYFGESDSSDFGITFDLGFMKQLTSLWGINSFWYGATLKDIGKGFNSSDTYTAFPVPFSAVVSGGFNPLENDQFKLGLGGDVLFQQGQDLRFKLASMLSIEETLRLGLSWQIDMQEIATSSIPERSYIPGFTISYSLQTNIKKDFLDIQERGWSKSELRTSAGILPLQDGAYAASIGVNMPLGVADKEPPEIIIDFSNDTEESDNTEEPESAGTNQPETTSLLLKGPSLKAQKRVLNVQADKKDSKITISKEIQPVRYLSPNNDGIKDELVIPFGLSDKRYIKGYVLRILDKNENVIQEIGNKEIRPENATIKDFFSRLFSLKEGIAIPDTIVWDGKSSEGTVVDDGVYYFYISAWDDNNNTSFSDVYSVVVDNTPPELSIEEINDFNKIFSPNNDGNKDTITFNQTGSRENKWNIQIIDVNGNTVRESILKNTEPDTYEWNGMDNSSSLLPDGVYSYKVSSTDLAGNSTQQSINNIIIDTQPTPIKVSIDSAYFSPNADEIKDTLTISIDVPQKSGLVSWSLEIKNSSNEPVVEFQDEGLPPTSIIYDGKSASGGIIPEGEYIAELKAVFLNGNSPVSVSPSFYNDITPPDASARALLDIFSPNGDGNKDELEIIQDGSREEQWKGEIISDSGTTVRTYTWVESPNEEIGWDGMTDIGILAEDGMYTYRLTATDRAGNSSAVQTGSFKLSTAESAVILVASSDAFSPNNDGSLDNITLSPDVKVAEGVESFVLEIFPEGRESVYTVTGSGSPDDAYIWRGVNNEGTPVAAGTYYGRISIVAKNGTRASSKSRNFIIDRDFPTADVSTAYTLFSPNGDGNKDVLEILQSSSRENVWTAVINDASGAAVREYRWTGSVENVSWDGTDAAGNPLENGTYTYILTAEDKAGNRLTKSIENIQIDNRRTTAYVTVSDKYLSPNGDDLYETLDFSTIVSLQEGISSWQLSISNENGKLIKTFSGEDRIPKKITWNGVGDNGNIETGTLTAKFSVLYDKGDNPVSTTAPFALDVTPPAIDLALSPVPFSPDNDGVEDELSIKINVNDNNPIQKWSLEIVDRLMVPFVTYSGTGAPKPEIIWNGIGQRGDLVIAAEDYPYRFTVTDVLGNTSTETGIIPIDVLVIREGDKLKIQIASINFEPNKAELSQETPEIIEKNTYVMNRLSQILKKYRSYAIVIEGHANPTRLGSESAKAKEEREELQPLSEARADTVRQALIERGINKNRIKIIGMGGTRTIADPLNREENWKNRRVEFILEK